MEEWQKIIKTRTLFGTVITEDAERQHVPYIFNDVYYILNVPKDSTGWIYRDIHLYNE